MIFQDIIDYNKKATTRPIGKPKLSRAEGHKIGSRKVSNTHFFFQPCARGNLLRMFRNSSVVYIPIHYCRSCIMSTIVLSKCSIIFFIHQILLEMMLIAVGQSQ